MRLFVGSPAIKNVSSLSFFRDKLSRYCSGLSFVPEENLHFTLKFLGEVKSPGEIIALLDQVKQKKFKIILRGTGVFSSEKVIKVIWIGAFSNEFIDLTKTIQELLKSIRREDHYEIVPHLTIARVRSQKDKNQLLKIVNKFKNKEFGEFVVEHFALYQSISNDGGVRYKLLKEFRLLD